MLTIRSCRVYPHVVVLTLLLFLTISCVADNSQDTQQNEKSGRQATLKIGDRAPDFSMRNQDQIKISLSEFKNKKIVILVFYPADFTPV